MFIVAGCVKTNNNEQLIALDAGDIKDLIPASSIFDSIHYVPLETNDSSIFKDIDKLCIDSYGNMFVLDIDGTNSVYMFGKYGRFKRKIGRSGRGPGEYVHIADINLYQDSIIEIYDSEQEKIIQYDTAGGVKNEIRDLEMGNACFFHRGDTLGFYMSCGSYAPNLNILVHDKEFLFFKQNYSELRRKGDYFYELGDSIYVTDNYNDTLYLLKNSSLLPYLMINFGKNRLPTEVRNVEQARQGNFCFDIGNFKFTSRFIHFSFVHNDYCVFTFYDKKNKQILAGTSIYNDIDSIPLLIYENTPNYNDMIVTYLRASIFMSATLSEKKSRAIKKLLQKVHEDSNPIIVFAFTKN